MGRVAATEFKAKCLELMDRVAERSESFVITKRGKPVARLGPVEEKTPKSILGALRGVASETGDLVSPLLPANAWGTLREWDELNAAQPPKRRPRKLRFAPTAVILLDTHVVFWATTRPDRLSRAATRAIKAAERAEGLAIASISLWELAALRAAGRLRVEGSMEGFLNKIATRAGVAVLDITPEIAVLAAQFPASFPGDPIDRLIGGTARAYGLTLVTKDERMQSSPLLRTLW